MIRQDNGNAVTFKRDKRGTTILRTAMRVSISHTPSIRRLRAALMPDNDWSPAPPGAA